MLKITRISYGGTAAIVAGMALITGLDAVGAAKKTIVSALLIAALADNLTDSLSVHIYQESEHLPQREAFRGTLSNFAARLAFSLTFILIVLLVPHSFEVASALAWGTVLLGALSYVLARERQSNAPIEVAKHLIVAALVIVVSRMIGQWISTQLAG